MSEIVILSHGGDPDVGTSTRVFTSDADPLPVTVVSGGAGGGGGDVNLIEVGGVAVALGQAAGAASVPVVVASDQSALGVVGNVAHDAVDSGNPVKLGAKAVTALPTAVSNLDRVDLVADTTGRLLVSQTVLDETTDGVAIGVDPGATATSTFLTTALTNTAQAVKASAGHVYDFFFDNSESASAAYVSLYNVASGSVSIGSSTGLIGRRKVPAGGTAEFSYGPEGHNFSTAISVVAHLTRTGSGAPTTNLHAEVSYI